MTHVTAECPWMNLDITVDIDGSRFIYLQSNKIVMGLKRNVTCG